MYTDLINKLNAAPDIINTVISIKIVIMLIK